MTIVPLAEAHDEQRFGGKAASLAKAIGAALPVPDGFAIPWQVVDALVGAHVDALVDAHDEAAIVAAYRAYGAPRVAVRSSAVGEDSLDASFAGQHVTILNVSSEAALLGAVRTIRESAHAESALAYRAKMGVTGEPRIAVVVQRLVDADVAGVLFTRNPMNGADERVLEATWGLGEAVVAGLVTPDRFRIDAGGTVLERTAGHKDLLVRAAPEGGTVESPVPPQDVQRLCLTDAQLNELHELAARCERHFGGPQDIEWAITNGTLFLLQSRPITVTGKATPPAAPMKPVDDDHAPLSPQRFAGLALAALLAPLNSTIIAVALPSIAGAFGSSPAIATRWLVTAYLVVTIVAQSPAGKLADLWGYSRVLTLGRAMFGSGALLAAFSPSLTMLGSGRALMAIGGALTIPTVFAQLRNSVPERKRGRVFGIFGAIMGAAAAAGPVLGGYLTARYGWHSIFFLNVPVVLLSFLLEPPRAEEVKARRKTTFDFAGSAILGAAVLLLVAAVNGTSLLYTLAALAALTAFVLRELRASDPVLDVRLFTHRAFAAGSSIVALQNLAMYAMMFLLPFFLAKGGGAPSATGRMLLIFTLSMVLTSPLGGRLSDAVGARIVAFSGAIVATSGAALYVARGELLAPLILMGVGIGIATSPSQAAALSAISAAQAGVASGALSTMRYAGGVIGSGLVALLATGDLTRDSRLLVFPAVLFASALAALALPGRASR